MVFKTIGERSRRTQVIDHVSDVAPGEIVLYRELEELLDADRITVQAAVNQAKAGLQAQHNKSVIAVPNIGYRVLHPNEHLDLARSHQRRGRRQTRRSKSAVVYTDYSQLSEIERVKYDIAAATLRALERFERRADLRYASRERVESFIGEQSSKNARTADDVESIKDRLARLETLMGRRTGE